MRASQLYFPTTKEPPADAEVISHQLMIRAGMIRRLAAGIYSWLPLGLRVLRKVEQVVREEMNHINAQEILMPNVQPSQLWQETARWQAYGQELLKFQDRHQRAFCLGPTSEEVITDLIRSNRHSYKQLPLLFYQIQTKFRDEVRPRFGIMRGREFMMKDAYSFHQDTTSLSETYQAMYTAYLKIFSRLGLQIKVVQADTGSIGGKTSHEFQVLAETGEDLIAFSDQGDYAANTELANRHIVNQAPLKPSQPLQKISTAGIKDIQTLSQSLNLPADRILKILFVIGSQSPLVGLLLRGDHTLNLLKTEKLPHVAKPLRLASDQMVQDITGCPKGFIGPVNLVNLPLIADHDAAALSDFVCGSNQENYHFKGVNWLRDTPLPLVSDLRQVMEGDLSPDGCGHLRFARGIEVGHTFQLGTQYSHNMQATFTTHLGQTQPFEMGCYGIGVSRIVAAAIEQHHDSVGIRWPDGLAPFQIAILPIAYHKNERIRMAALQCYEQLLEAGFEVLLDDRELRPGVLLTEIDLIGIPHRLVLSEQSLARGQIEYKKRGFEQCQWIPTPELLNFLTRCITNPTGFSVRNIVEPKQ